MKAGRLEFAACATFAMMFLTACNAARFSSSKQDLLSSKSALNGGAFEGQIDQPAAPGNGIANGSINQPDNGSSGGAINQPSGDTASGSVNQPAEDGKCIANCPARGDVNQIDRTNDEIDFLLLCSDKDSQEHGNYKGALVDPSIAMKLIIGNQVCTNDKTKIKTIVEKKNFTINEAKQICPALVPSSGRWSNVSLMIGNYTSTAKGGMIEVTYARNRDKDIPAAEMPDELCDGNSSPLVIHLNSNPVNPQPIALSSIEDGILFDLLGITANHNKVQISWFTNNEYGLLALPDSAGNVNNIDHLFGNATLGPDRLLSENGYEALAKYDGTTADGIFRLSHRDGIIDRNDAVYTQLRVWVDANRDGLGQERELMSLRQAGIAYIDLDYSDEYAERDVHGNETKMKSVVGRFDGSMDLIFDLWFRYRASGD